MLKILDFLRDNLGSDYSKTEIAERCDLSRGTLFSVWPKLEALELVVLTREVGRAKMYKLIKKNPIAGKLIELDSAIADFYATKLINCNTGIEENVLEPYLSSAEEQLHPRKEIIVS